MRLSELSPAHGEKKAKKRVGRGESSGMGKTCGRGNKGQKARTGGKVRIGFEGGQMPLYRRVPKFGFISRKRTLGLNLYQTVSLSILDKFEDGATVDPESLRSVGYGPKGKLRAGIKILGSGELKKKLNVKANAFTETARNKIEALGGTIEVIE